MFNTLPVQSLSFSANSLPISTVRHNPRRIPAVHCRAATVENFSRCLSMPSSLYEVLKVNQSASPADIKKAYRRLAKIYHPDVADTSPDDRDFIQIHDAYETLSDPKARAMYDLSINLVARRTVARSTGSTSFSSTVGRRPGFYTTRRWDCDQCW